MRRQVSHIMNVSADVRSIILDMVEHQLADLETDPATGEQLLHVKADGKRTGQKIQLLTGRLRRIY